MYCKKCGAENPREAKYCTSCGSPVEENVSQLSQPSGYHAGPPVPCDGILPSQVAVTHSVEAHITTTEPVRRRRRPAGVTILLAMLCFGIVFIFEIIGYLVSMIPGMPLNSDLLVTLAGAVGACLSLVILGGRKLLGINRNTIVLALRKGWWVLATSLGLTIFAVVETILTNETVIEDGWSLRLLKIVVYCIGIGVFEEASFRGLIFGSLLDVGGRGRKGLFFVAILAAILFGMAHIDWFGINYADPLSILQAVLKIIQTGLFGFFLNALVLRSGSIWGAALLHGLSNFIIMIPSMVLRSGPTDFSYIGTGEEAIANVILYLAFIACYTPLAIIGKQMLSQHPLPDFGPFHKER